MENFYLEKNEELFSIIDRIRRSRDRRITLIIPAGLQPLRSIINLKILKEEIISMGKDVSIVTADSLIKKLAQQVNLPILDKIQEEPQIIKKSNEERRQVEFERKLKSGKRIISDIVRPVEPVKVPREEVLFTPEPETPETETKQIEKIPEADDFGEEFRDLGEKEEQFDELFGKKKETRVKETIKEEKRREEKRSFRFFTAKRVMGFLIVLFLIAVGFVLYFILPKAEIVINPKKEDISLETEITADKNINSIDLENNEIPAQIFQIETEDSRTFPTTGEKEVEEKAKGTIVIYNQYSSSEQTLVKTTRFLSENGKIFRLTDTVVIPGASIDEGKIIPSSKEVTVEADEAGDAYNIGPSKFTIPGFEGTAKYAAFYGQSSAPMTGGAKGMMKVATKEDIDGAIQIVSAELKNKVSDEFKQKIPTELKMLDNSQVLEVTESDSTLDADEPGKEFTVTVKVKAWGLAFKEDDVLSLIKNNINDKISQDKILIPSTIKVDYENVKTDSAKSKTDFIAQAQAKTAWNIDEDLIKKDLAGKDEIEVRKYLSSLAEIETAKVIFWPFWVKRIPTNKDKIKIVIKPE
ncbi:MAG: hypothetical protein COU82_00245 [Candidatus Portnoybacteria bacterium CG10_big_fil_rev_8_21_14_0_10_38_18]|uniref:GlxA-like beta barrel domain-containing protein n=1 Tax=Candidatus Portnoybacteria bacterium CG10_big_fil_rev_8_21_14_0_10_38_18 TaxID=1974813 RepID=A0A2M8KCV0_9BACT|nr:MAG: hypothetical protein COU82_00245 [Candidatus Portnoybacteria bacterium CG10_big_fil_rev_8_21_14_0_10_38_18]